MTSVPYLAGQTETRTESSSPRITAGVAHQPVRLAWPRRLSIAIGATDLVAISLAVVVAQLTRFGVDTIDASSPGFDAGYTVLGAGIVAAWMAALWAVRSREMRIIAIGLIEYQRVVQGTLWTFGLLAIAAYLAKVDVARGYLAIALPIGLGLLLAGRMSWRRALARLRRAGRCLTGVILVGPSADIREVARELENNLAAGYRPIAAVVTDDGEIGRYESILPRVATERLPAVAKATRTRAVMIAGNLPGGRGQIKDLGWSLEGSDTELILLSRLTDVAGPRIHLRQVQGLPMVHVDLPRYSGFNYAVKRTGDIIGATLGLLFIAPVFLSIAFLILLTSRGPVFFRQQRVGVGGSTFGMLKFRSMVVDAERRLDELRDRDEGNGIMFKMRDDPRVTPLGRFLRRYSLDELPQLINVLVGDMSLVGPRPPLPLEVEQYEDRVHRRLLIKPGITGLWQVSGRSNLSWDESVRLDLYYVENWSVITDLVILARTVKAVLKRDGAY